MQFLLLGMFLLQQPVVDEYFGIKVADPFRWLENADDPAVKKWSDDQNRRARAVLDQLPARPAIHKRLTELRGGNSARYGDLQYRGGSLFAVKNQPPREQPLLVMLKSAADLSSERAVLDLMQYDPKGSTAIDFYSVSHDGKLAAVSLSVGGSEDGSVHIFETATGKALSDVVPRVTYPTGGGSVAWTGDNSGFFYTRYPQGNERPKEDANFFQQIWYHKLGTASSADTYVLGKDFPRIAETVLDASEDGRYILASVENGDGGEYAHYLRVPSGQWTQITRFTDKVVQAALGRDGALYMLSRQDAPRGKILRLPLDKPALAEAKVIADQSAAVIQSLVPAATRLYVLTLAGGPSEIRVFDLQGRAQAPVPIKSVSSVWQVQPLSGDQVLYQNETFLEPAGWYQYDPPRAPERTAMFGTSKADFGDIEVVRKTVPSKDGTPIPLNILQRRGIKLDGKNPVLFTGYGGFDVSIQPYFDVTRRLWLDSGGVWAIANLRGGSEFGEEWHTKGNLTNKQNVFDDFAACAQYFLKSGYTTPDRLAIEGGSNGGLLMGATLTQHPDLFRAVVSHVGIYDMLRVELDPNGQFNTTEYGTVKNRDQFNALYAYSPYHHVKDGTAYPSILFLTGANDGRVNPAHSRKMIARLQAAAVGSQRPILLRTSDSSGHGIGTALSERVNQEADVYAFLFSELGIKP